jgi:pilus assembly protein Flp/PilA
MRACILKLFRDERGVTAVEYGLLAALISIAAVTAITSVGTTLTTTFNDIASRL